MDSKHSLGKYRNWYQKLIRLYPKKHRDLFGESMMQTFDDLSNEKQHSRDNRILSFLLWIFVETTFAVLKEYSELINGVLMKTIKRTIAATELLVIIPATLFIIALFMREVQPQLQTGLLVDWFSRHTVLGLYVFLVAMPFAALVTGGTALFRTWRNDVKMRQDVLKTLVLVRTHLATLFIAMATLMSVVILAVVALHMITE